MEERLGGFAGRFPVGCGVAERPGLGEYENLRRIRGRNGFYSIGKCGTFADYNAMTEMDKLYEREDIYDVRTVEELARPL